MVGANHDNEWLIEGRRMTPIVPRQPTQTAFTQTADHISAKQVGVEDCKITKVPSIRTLPPYKTHEYVCKTAQSSVYSDKQSSTLNLKSSKCHQITS